MPSIFATPYTLSSYTYPINVTTTKVSLGAVTIPDPGFDWTPIVFAQVSFYSSTKECGALVEARLGTTSSGTLLASGSQGSLTMGANFLATVDVAPAYQPGASAPSYSGSQTITLWIVRLSGASTGTVNMISGGGMRANVYALPTS